MISVRSTRLETMPDLSFAKGDRRVGLVRKFLTLGNPLGFPLPQFITGKTNKLHLVSVLNTSA